jgi:AcrR family transcriptional regulator
MSSKTYKTYERILDATIELLRAHGPVDFRIEDLVAATGQSVGGIYHHFGNRDGLLIAAYDKLVGQLLGGDAELLRVHLDTSTDADEFLAGIRLLIANLQSPERTELRWLRLEGLALARRKPALWEALKEIHVRHAQGLTEGLAEAQQRGWLRGDIDPYHLYLVLTGVVVGSVADNIGRQVLDPAAWSDDIFRLLGERSLIGR